MSWKLYGCMSPWLKQQNHPDKCYGGVCSPSTALSFCKILFSLFNNCYSDGKYTIIVVSSVDLPKTENIIWTIFKVGRWKRTLQSSAHRLAAEYRRAYLQSAYSVHKDVTFSGYFKIIKRACTHTWDSYAYGLWSHKRIKISEGVSSMPDEV